MADCAIVGQSLDGDSVRCIGLVVVAVAKVDIIARTGEAAGADADTGGSGLRKARRGGRMPRALSGGGGARMDLD